MPTVYLIPGWDRLVSHTGHEMTHFVGSRGPQSMNMLLGTRCTWTCWLVTSCKVLSRCSRLWREFAWFNNKLTHSCSLLYFTVGNSLCFPCISHQPSLFSLYSISASYCVVCVWTPIAMLTHDNMVPKTNRIEDFSDHWKATLLGDEFWKDAEDWNKETNNKIEAGKFPVPTHFDSTSTYYCIQRWIILAMILTGLWFG